MRPGKTKPDPKREEVLRRLFPWAAILLGVIWLVLYFLYQR